MPTPRPSEETESEWMERCIPVVLEDGTAETNEQAVAVCSSMWREATKAVHPGGQTMPTDNLTKLRIPLEIKELHDREFEGHAAIFGNVDLGGDIVAQGAFSHSLEQHRKAGTLPPMFWMHNPSQVPGIWREMKEDSKGLRVVGELVETQLGDEMRTLLKKKAVRGLSVGFVPVDIDFDKRGHRILKQVDLWEASLVSLAMNPRAKVTSMKARLSLDGEYVPTERELELDLRDAGCSKSLARTLVARVHGKADGGMPCGCRWDAGEGEDEEARLLLPGAEKLLSSLLQAAFNDR